MDLSTVKKNLLADKFKQFEDFVSDLKLIWENCQKYNAIGT